MPLHDRFRHYLTGIDSIDAEHIELWTLMAHLEKHLPTDLVELSKRIHEIADKFKTHFKNEEQLMDDVDYPYTKYHMQMHKDILVSLQAYELSPSPYSARFATQRVSDHFMSHVDQHDIQLAQHIKRVDDKGSN